MESWFQSMLRHEFHKVISILSSILWIIFMVFHQNLFSFSYFFGHFEKQ
uniref:Uncharacterized protein n=1 Tax=Rhizophora mucronata TaxID=61149 RepID=A0A2P2QNQ7_RHIMU